MKEKVWILTEEYNDYDQHGEYFISVFKDKPTIAQLMSYHMSEAEAKHVQNGGGRLGVENQWFLLKEEELL
jgi:hypothetical protein